ncbi:MAG: serine/threonine protein phosphatase [Methanobrevibacter sp.]|uniref:LytS/YhcK type 5TM receptor domain-containing protein n=1 Tax=Methanobrevibacter sp. TaxID=66852 RepID=UPI0025F963D0|nr:LytS/YhcK type 5TM receptor domain-containing protein [Methanobrevibacter sp.]MBQ6098553.1 serine/threonine protein phosphatase [Methanobrevibacter sp.]
MLKKDKIIAKHDNVKINIIFLLLIFANLILFGYLIKYLIFNPHPIQIEFETVNSIFTIISGIIILGFISTRLPQFRKLGDSAIYEIGYLVILGIFSILLSYFNESTHSKPIIAPFLDMFKVLSVILIFTIIATRTRPFKEMIKGKITKKNIFICFCVFTILGILATHYHVYIMDTPANVRNLIIMIGGLFGGPYVGIPSAIISGVYRFLQGGPTATPCSISTVISGVVGSLIYLWNGKKFPRTIPVILLMVLYTGFDMLLILVLTPERISIPYVAHIYPLVLFASVIGIILFKMIIKETHKESNPKEISYEELKIRELENIIDEHDEKIEELENKLKELKKEKSNYESQEEE